MGKLPLILTLLVIMPVMTRDSLAQTETLLYTFTGGSDGGVPYAGLLADGQGHLYGTAQQYADGSCTLGYAGCGTVFELTPTEAGWNFKVLHTFHGGEDGANPSSSLVFDSNGNLYGTTVSGGTGCGGYGCGTVFELRRSGDGWQESILYRFTGRADGEDPIGSVALDGAGNIYGTTAYGGDNSCFYEGVGCGVVFQLKRSNAVDDEWTETVLHTFHGTDGAEPFVGVTLVPPQSNFPKSVGPPGTIYGTTLYGGEGQPGDIGGGVVFQVMPSGDSWSYRTLYEFSHLGGRPGGPLTFDDQGNLYGMAGLNGRFGAGSVFEVRRMGPEGSDWIETDIYSFRGPPDDGWFPLYQGVVMDQAGNLYGSTPGGGTSPNCFGGCGTEFRLSKSNGIWSESMVYSLTGNADGWSPFAGGPVVDEQGNIYAMTPFGGDTNCLGLGQPGCGVVFRISP